MKCFTKIVKGYNYFHSFSFSRPLLNKINKKNILNAGLIFPPEVFILYKKVWEPKGPRAVNFNIYFIITAFH